MYNRGMKYFSVEHFANEWNLSPRSVRNYCSSGRIKDVYIEGGEWMIPENSIKPERKNAKKGINHLLVRLREEKKSRQPGGIYHRLQIDMTYNSNRIEGSKLSHDATRYIFETRTIGLDDNNSIYDVDDLIETINHFECIDRVIDFANYELSISFIKELHRILKTGTSDARKSYFAVGDFKRLPNEVGDRETTSPRMVKQEMESLLSSYNSKAKHTFDEILDFHVKFERIHPFQDGNGRIGRLIILKECLMNNIVPFIITDDIKYFYYRGLSNWDEEKGWLRDTCLSGQDEMKKHLDYFKIKYEK